jgi:sec-independent protein translocase protein TatA
MFCRYTELVCIFAKIFFSDQLINLSVMGGGEIVLIIFVALLFFGSKAIPDVAKMMGKAMREFQKATNEIKREINDAGGLGDEIKEIKSTIQGARSDIEDGIKKHTSDINHEIHDISSDINKETENITTTITNEAKMD